jgi:protein-tyrosine phosphatase
VRFAVLFGLCALGLAALAAGQGGWAWFLLWPALSLALVSAGYAGLGPRLLGKRGDGRLAWWAVVLLLPYLVLTWLFWHAYRLVTPTPVHHEVTPGLWLGRRAFPHELPPGVTLVVDLTAEFPAARGVIVAERRYLCLPTLDGMAPDEARLREVVEIVAAWEGPVYLHCAQGFGRSALVAAGVLMARGHARDGDEALALLRKARPGVKLRPVQRRLLDRLVPRERP